MLKKEIWKYEAKFSKKIIYNQCPRVITTDKNPHRVILGR